MTPLPLIPAAIFVTGNCSCKIVHGICKSVIEIFAAVKFLSLEIRYKKENLDVRPLSEEKGAPLPSKFYLIVVSIFLKTCVKDHEDNSGQLLQRRI